ncbi:DASH complex subunit dad4 [Paraconiothyrium brasiliense]|uniref:DASH complex subunit DAD4 n=1 Tax=Paraconiothyrium brasiliense TaxID=300254 RepID=A0ABR3S0T8_9PLEO
MESPHEHQQSLLLSRIIVNVEKLNEAIMTLNKNLQEINIANMDTELVSQMFKNYQSNVLFHLEGSGMKGGIGRKQLNRIISPAALSFTLKLCLTNFWLGSDTVIEDMGGSLCVQSKKGRRRGDDGQTIQDWVHNTILVELDLEALSGLQIRKRVLCGSHHSEFSRWV